MSDENTTAPAATQTPAPNADPFAGITTINPPPGGYPDHPLAAIFPMLPPNELADLGESIKAHGQRDEIVLLDGQVLDGRNRQAACAIVDVTARYRVFDPAVEGNPSEYVLDKNLRRRDLTPSQKATAAAELMPILEREAAARQEATRFSASTAEGLTDTERTELQQAARDDQATENAEFDADTEEEKHAAERAAAGADHGAGNFASTGESTVDTTGDFAQVAPKKAPATASTGTKGNSRTKAAAAVGVSERMVQDAKKLQTEDPKAFAEVKSGAKSLGAAMKGTPTAGTKAASEYEQALEAIGRVCGEKMVKAIKEGGILRNRKEVIEFASLPDEKMKGIEGLIGIGWSVKKALHHKTETLLSTHQIMDAISKAAQNGGSYTQLIDAPETGSDWEISIKRKAHPAPAKPAAASSTPAQPAEKPAAPAAAPAKKEAAKKAAAPAKAKPAPKAKVNPEVIRPGAKGKGAKEAAPKKKVGFKHPLADKPGRKANGGTVATAKE